MPELGVSATAKSEATCRIDVWLWRARFFKTRSLAAAAIDAGRIRLTRHDAAPSRLDKASRTVRPGDSLVFVLAGRVHLIRVRAVGERRGPPVEARTLYEGLDDKTASAIDNQAPSLTNTPAPAGASPPSLTPVPPRVTR